MAKELLHPSLHFILVMSVRIYGIRRFWDNLQDIDPWVFDIGLGIRFTADVIGIK